MTTGGRLPILDDRHYPLTLPLAASRAINLTGRLTVTDLCAVMAACQVVVAPDTGTLHLGEALGVPTIGYFTMVPPEVRSAGYRHVRTFLRRGALCPLLPRAHLWRPGT